MELTEALLRDALGVENALHRKKIVAHIKLLRAASRPVARWLAQQPGSGSGCRAMVDAGHAKDEDEDDVSTSTACTALLTADASPAWLAGEATDTHSTIRCLLDGGRCLQHHNAVSQLAQTQPLVSLQQPRLPQDLLRQSHSVGTLPSETKGRAAGACIPPLGKEVRGPLALYRGMSATARRAAQRSNLDFDWSHFELTGQCRVPGEVSPVAGLAEPPQSPLQQSRHVRGPRRFSPAPRFASDRGAASGGPAAMRSPSQTPRTPSTREARRGDIGGESPATPLKRSHSATPVSTASTVPCGQSFSTCASVARTAAASRHRRELGGDGLTSAEMRSPRAFIGSATRDAQPFWGKLAWQLRQSEATPGVGAYSPHSHTSFLAKPARGSTMGQARRFGDMNNYPAWL